jgi:pyroglutamyl-peptidase
MKLLLTGFEPFGDSEVNPSEEVVKGLSKHHLSAVELVTTILPVDKEAGPAKLIQKFEETRPKAVVCLGEAGGRMVICIERIAINLMDYRIEDNVGNLIKAQPIVLDGSAAFFCTLPVQAIVEGLKEADIPSRLSLSAGAFLCNHVIYTLLYHLETHNMEIPAGFIHLPSLPEQVAGEQPPKPSMNLETMVTGVKTAIEVIRQNA